ncbi:MAG: hypothetical protein WA087_04235 [Candidatus Saccharimonadales bacterium]
MTYFLNQKNLKIKTAGLFFFIIMSATVCAMMPPATARALDGWQAGNIISDAVFTHANSMSVSQIQTFLNSKVPTCDTNGTLPASEFGRPDLTHAQYAASVGWPAPPYTCLKNYRENSLSAAQIIYNISQEYDINPQVFIVLLQKEQGLVTDTWPLPNQYKMAAGYGCPDDGSGCDSKYYGFTKQLHWAATLFHTVVSGNQSWSNPYGSGTSWYSPYILGNNRIYYNPSASCGYSTVNIQNLSTAALYDYTPYQPNKAALNAGYGTAPPCGAYGNRNFYLYFTNWFGSTYVPTVFKTTQSDQAYLLSGNKYYRFSSLAMLTTYGFKRSDIGVVTPNMLDLYQDGGTLKNITRVGGGDEIYLIDNGKLLLFASSELYNTYGYIIDGKEQDLDPLILDHLSIGPTLTDIIRSTSKPEVYIELNGKKSHIGSSVAYSTMGDPIYSSRIATNLSQSYIDSIPTGPPVIVHNSFVKNPSNNKAYFWDGATIQLIDNQTVLELSLGISYTSPTVGLLPLSTNPTISKLIKDTDGKLYIINNKQKLEIQPTSITNLGLNDSDFTVVSTGLTEKLALPTIQFFDSFRINNSPEVYIIKSRERYHITTSLALAEQGLRFSQVINLSTQTSALFPDSGKKILPLGQLFRIGTTAAVYIVNSDNSSLYVTSSQLIHSYGLSVKNIISYTTKQVSGYPNSGNLQYFAKDSSNNVWLIDNFGQKRQVPIDISGPLVLNLNIATLPTISDTIINRLTAQPTLTTLMQVNGQDQVYKIEKGFKCWITSRQIFKSLGLSLNDIRNVSNNFNESIPTGEPLR